MAKKSRSPRHAPIAPQKPNWFVQHPNLSALLIYFFLVALFFFDVLFSGKTFLSPDAQGPSALAVPLKEALDSTGSMPLWSPHVFCGLPSFGSLLLASEAYLPGWIFKALRSVVNLRDIVFHVLHYVLAGMGTYLLLRRRGTSFAPALLSGMAFMFTPYLITMEAFGHGSQMMTTAYLPFTFWAVDRLFEKRDMLSLGLAGLIIGLQLQRGHVQISYYILMLLGGYWLYSIIIRARAQRGKEIVPLTLRFGVALALAAALAAVLYLPIQEYTPYSIRGAQSVLQESAPQGGDTGVGFEYATQWSFSPGEMMTFVLPSFFGFGGATYWGTMPFTDYPNYMGIIILALAIVAVVLRRPLTGFLAIVFLLALLISFGKHLFVYQLLYDYLPYFNKFRVPVMILVLVQFSVAVMAGLGLEALLEKVRAAREQAARREDDAGHQALAQKLFIFAALLIGLALLVSVAHDGFFGMMQDVYPDRYEPQTQIRLDEARFGLLFGDTWKLALALGGGLSLTALAYKKTIGATALAAGLFALSLLDLWMVDYQLNKPKPERGREAYFAADEATLFLKTDTTNFRIFPIELFGENRWAAHGIQSIGGYHPAKPRAYQDLLDASGINNFSAKYFRQTVSQGRPSQENVPIDQVPARERQRDLWLLDLLNVKYVLSVYPLSEPNFILRAQVRYDYQGQMIPLAIYENATCLPRPYLVGGFEHIAQPSDALERLVSGDFNPRQSVILDAAPDLIPQPDSSAIATLENYDLRYIDVRTRSSSPQFLVLSDNYYPVGWTAYLDGAPRKTYRANFCFRAVAVPAGQHRIEFRMASPAFTAGFWTTVVSAVVITGLLLVGWRQRQISTAPSDGVESGKSKQAPRGM